MQMSDERGARTIRVMAVGDAVGRPGRNALKKLLPQLRIERQIDFIIANGENSAGGKGISSETAREMFAAGVDVITTGNHVWDNKDVFKIIESEQRLLRPANFAQGMGVPGRGCAIYDVPERGTQIAVINIIGRVHMAALECPFRHARAVLDHLPPEVKLIFVDFHAEATSEKIAMGWFLDGKVTCIFGTHTHVPTADERLLHNGTAYITDIGMTGGYDGVIGVTVEPILERFLKGMPVRHAVAEENVNLSGIIVTADADTGRALGIERLFVAV